MTPAVACRLTLAILLSWTLASQAQQQDWPEDPTPSLAARSEPGLNLSLPPGLSTSNTVNASPIQASVSQSGISARRPSIDSDATGSTDVPMDSWIYPALERLAALGLVPTQTVSIRPWTRQECRRQIREAEDLLYGFGALENRSSAGIRQQAELLLPDLEQELQEPGGRQAAVLDSAYVRAGTIAGPALTDGFHFGQTWWNDSGRPLGRGTSAILGLSIRAVDGRFFFADRQELQTDPGTPAITPARALLFNQLDNLPFMQAGATIADINPGALISPASAVNAYVRQRPLELYVGIAAAGNSLSFGKQEIYWGPTTIGPLSFSNNAEPTYNLRYISTRPHPFPFFPELGSYRFDLVFGKLSGHQHPARPYFNGQKADFLLGHNFEISFTRWSILWGVGHPMTLGSLKRNFFSSSSTGTNFQYGDREDPGDRKSAFDFRLHVPGVSKYVTLYTDAYADDELNPIDAPRRVVWSPGIYLARLPFAPRADFRLEVVSTEEMSQDEGGTRFFINNQYRDGNTNKGFLLGTAAGRDARVFEGRLGYWISGRTHVEAAFRDSHGGTFLPGGSSISDVFGNVSYAISSTWSMQLFSQYERFLIPSDLAGAQKNGSGRIQLTWTPKNFTLTH